MHSDDTDHASASLCPLAAQHSCSLNPSGVQVPCLTQEGLLDVGSQHLFICILA